VRNAAEAAAGQPLAGGGVAGSVEHAPEDPAQDSISATGRDFFGNRLRNIRAFYTTKGARHRPGHWRSCKRSGAAWRLGGSAQPSEGGAELSLLPAGRCPYVQVFGGRAHLKLGTGSWMALLCTLSTWPGPLRAFSKMRLRWNNYVGVPDGRRFDACARGVTADAAGRGTDASSITDQKAAGSVAEAARKARAKARRALRRKNYTNGHVAALRALRSPCWRITEIR